MTRILYSLVISIWLTLAAFPQAAQHDLLLKGGHVIDPRNNIDGVLDVAIKGDRIPAVGAGLPATLASKTIDVSGLYITPGLIDIHVHVFVQSDPGTVYGDSSRVFPAHAGFRTGVTTMVDAGTTGWGGV